MAAAKKDLQVRFSELVEEMGDPLEEIFRIGMDLDEDAGVRLKALESAASYGYAKKKSIEHTILGDPENPLKLSHGIDIKALSDKDIDHLLKLIGKATISE